MYTVIRYILLCLCMLLLPHGASSLYAQEQRKATRTIVFAGDWDKAPYEFFRDDSGLPAGFNVDVINAIMEEMNVPCQVKLEEWSKAVAAFERGDVDLIFGDIRRYHGEHFYATQNIIYYYRIAVASLLDSTVAIPLEALKRPDDTKFYRGGYSAFAFKDWLQDSVPLSYMSPKMALEGLMQGSCKYYVWGEEALRWKLKELHLGDTIKVHEVELPMGEIRILGHDRMLIDEVDACFSRLKQRGDIEELYNQWFHPERLVHDKTSPISISIIASVLLFAGMIYLFTRFTKSRIRNITRRSTDLHTMMYHALHMGNFHVMEYNVKKNLFSNYYGTLLPEKGMTLEQFTERIYPDEQKEFTRKMQMLLSGRESRFELEKSWNAGTKEAPSWLRFHGFVMAEQDEDGKPEYIINVIHDITHDVNEQKENRAIQRQFERLFNLPKLAMSFYSREGWLIKPNGKMEELCRFDHPKSEHFWRSKNMYGHSLFHDAYPPGSSHNLQVCQKMEYPEVGLKNYIEFHVLPVRSKEGSVLQYLLAAFDLNEDHDIYTGIATQTKQQHKIQQQIEGIKRRLHHLMVDSNIYFYQLDLLAHTISFSQALGEVSRVLSMDEYLEMVDEEGCEDMEGLLHGNENQTVRYRHFKRTSIMPNPQWVCYIGTPKYDDKGERIGEAGIMVVLTELIEAQRRLRDTTALANDSIRLKSLFLASMTHELRTPLNAIVGFTTLLQMTEDPAERVELIKIVHNGCDMLERLINDILEASSVTTDASFTPMQENVDFAYAFDSMCIPLQQRVEQANLVFVKDNPYQDFFTTIDVTRIQQVVTNFITNAVKFTQQGHIKLGYRYEQRGIYIYCEDTGIGIPKDKQEIVFERFVKLDEFIQGTGMGLAICKSIVERLGGQIGVESEGDGTGSTFWIRIPCERQLHRQ